MNKFIYSILYIFSFFLILSCSDSKKKSDNIPIENPKESIEKNEEIISKDFSILFEKNGFLVDNDSNQNFSGVVTNHDFKLNTVEVTNGILNGPFESYDNNGNLKLKGIYKNGIRFGKWEEYQREKVVNTFQYDEVENDVNHKSYFKNGLLQQKLITDENNNIIFIINFEDGIIVSKGKVSKIIDQSLLSKLTNKSFQTTYSYSFEQFETRDKYYFIKENNLWYNKIDTWEYNNPNFKYIEKHTYLENDDVYYEQLDESDLVILKGRLTKSEESNFNQFFREGPWYFYDNDKLSYIKNFSQDEVTSIKRYINDKHLTTESVDKTGKRVGQQIYFDLDGNLIGEIDLQRDQYGKIISSGTYVEYYDYKSLKKIENYLFGQKNGTFTEYYENGNLKSISNFDRNLESGPQKTFYSNGQLKDEYFHFIHDPTIYREGGLVVRRDRFTKRTGPYVEYYSNGQLKEKGITFWEGFQLSTNNKYKQMYNNGSIHPFIKYYENGNIEEEGNYKVFNKIKPYEGLKVVRDGNWRTYHLNGNPKSTMNYTTIIGDRDIVFYGVGDGPFEEFYESGNLKKTGQYSKSNMSPELWDPYTPGLVTIFYKNGNKKEETFYRKGNRFGERTNTSVWSKKYFNNGNLKYEYESMKLYKRYYENGKTKFLNQKTSEKYYQHSSFYENGNISHYGFVESLSDTVYVKEQNNRPQRGFWTLFDIDGNKILEETYDHNGLRKGTTTKYYPNGNIKFIGNYGCYDSIDGWTKSFDQSGELIIEHLYECGKIIDSK